MGVGQTGCPAYPRVRYRDFWVCAALRHLLKSTTSCDSLKCLPSFKLVKLHDQGARMDGRTLRLLSRAHKRVIAPLCSQGAYTENPLDWVVLRQTCRQGCRRFSAVLA